MSKRDRKAARQALRKATLEKIAPQEATTTRRMSDSRLMAMLDDHMLESLSDIGAVYQRLASSLGYRKANFEPRVVSSSPDPNKKLDKALDSAAEIADWRKACTKWGMNSRVVMLVVADGQSLSGVMRELGIQRDCARVHLRGCLTVWSMFKRRVMAVEVQRHHDIIRACCLGGKRLRLVKS